MVHGREERLAYRRITLLCERLIYAIMPFFFTNALSVAISECGTGCTVDSNLF